MQELNPHNNIDHGSGPNERLTKRSSRLMKLFWLIQNPLSDDETPVAGLPTPPPLSASTTLSTSKGEKCRNICKKEIRLSLTLMKRIYRESTWIASNFPISDSGVYDLLKGKAKTGDTAIFSGTRDDYRISNNGDGTYSVKSLRGTDTVSNVQNLQFDDGYVLLSSHNC